MQNTVRVRSIQGLLRVSREIAEEVDKKSTHCRHFIQLSRKIKGIARSGSGRLYGFSKS